jgi:acetylornithine deacetylase
VTIGDFATTGVERAVVAAVNEDRLLDRLFDLVSLPSVSTRESIAQDYMEDALHSLGAEVDAWDIDMARLSRHPSYSAEFDRTTARGVVGTVHGTASGSASGPGGRRLLINGHVDVVPPGDDANWTSPPFQPEVRGGAVYGRGSCDTKGGLAAALEALGAVRDAGVTLTGEVALTTVVGEEDGGCGTLAALERGITADGCVVLEPTDLAVVPAVAGALSFRIRIAGRSAHGAIREEGVSAIEKLPIVHRALVALEHDRNVREADPLFGWLERPFAICAGRVAGGDWPSSEADWLVLEGRYGVGPDEDLDEARAELETTVWSAALTDDWLSTHPPTVAWWGGQFLPGRTAVGHPLVTDVSAALTAVTGRPADVRGMPYGCDMGLFTRLAEIPTVVFGPGDIRDAHRPDEHVAVADLVTAAQTLAATIVRHCGSTP